MSRILIVGNWKMNLNASQASMLVHKLEEKIPILHDIEVVIAPSMLTLQPLSIQIDRRKFRLAAQNAYHKDEGAFTGEISFTMLRDLVHYVIIGHSERRHIFHEDLPLIKAKMAACVRNEITPILCVGETKHEKDEGETKQVIHDQLMTALSNITAAEVAKCAIAYEPVWAISDGANYANHVIAKPDEVQKATDYIRNYINDVFGARAAKEVRILYGGSVVPDVVHGFLNIPGINGFLVGGASLNYEIFSNIVNSTQRWLRDKVED